MQSSFIIHLTYVVGSIALWLIQFVIIGGVALLFADIMNRLFVVLLDKTLNDDLRITLIVLIIGLVLGVKVNELVYSFIGWH